VKHFGLIKQAISDEGLIKRSKEAAAKVESGSSSLSSKVRGVTASRVSGASLWIDTDSNATQQQLLVHLRSHGILVKANGTSGLVARPSLMFGAS